VVSTDASEEEGRGEEGGRRQEIVQKEISDHHRIFGES
jgi:hypothetical protein